MTALLTTSTLNMLEHHLMIVWCVSSQVGLVNANHTYLQCKVYL